MALRYKHRRDTAANYTSNNPILEDGELAFETDTGKSKLGDGVTAWNSLSYTASGGSGGSGTEIGLGERVIDTTLSGPAGQNEIRFDNLTTVTEVYLHEDDENGTDRSASINEITATSQLKVRLVSDPENFFKILKVVSQTDNTGNHTIVVTQLETKGDWSGLNGQAVSVNVDLKEDISGKADKAETISFSVTNTAAKDQISANYILDSNTEFTANLADAILGTVKIIPVLTADGVSTISFDTNFGWIFEGLLTINNQILDSGNYTLTFLYIGSNTFIVNCVPVNLIFGADLEAPQLVGSPFVQDAAPNDWIFNFNENVTYSTGLVLKIDGIPATVTGVAGSGTSQLTLTTTETVVTGNVLTYDYSSSGNLIDSSGNEFADVTGGSVTNNVGSLLLLDVVTTAAQAVSFRKLKADYVGNCCRIRRSSDNVEQDFGFSGNLVDSAAIATFLGASQGYVVTLYDQSDNARHVTMSTQANQPKYDPSTLSIPSCLNDADTQALAFTGTLLISQPMTVIFHGQESGDGTNTRYLFDSKVGTDPNRVVLGKLSTNKWFINAGATISSAENADSLVHVFAAVYDGASSRLLVDNVEKIAADAGTNSHSGAYVGGRNVLTASTRGNYTAYVSYARTLTPTELSDVQSILGL